MIFNSISGPEDIILSGTAAIKTCINCHYTFGHFRFYIALKVWGGKG